MSSSRLKSSCLKRHTLPPQLLSPSSTTPPSTVKSRHCLLRWNEPIAQYRAIPAKEDDYYATFQDLPFNLKTQDEEDEPPVPFIRSQRIQSKPALSTPEPTWLQSIITTADDDINMGFADLDSTEQVTSSGCSRSSSGLHDITLIEIDDCTTSSSTIRFSTQAYNHHSPEDDQRLENYIMFMNLNPGYGILNKQLKHLNLEPILQESQQEQTDQPWSPSHQQFHNIIGMSMSSVNEGCYADGAGGISDNVISPVPSAGDPHLPLPIIEGSPRAPLAILQTNTPSASPGPGTSTPSHIWDNSYPRPPSEESEHRFHPNQNPGHSIQANHKNYSKPNQSAVPESPSPSEKSATPANPPHHHAHTNKLTGPVHSGLGAYTNTQPPRPTAAPSTAVASTSARTLSAQPSTNEAPDDDVDMEPPASESESEDGEIDDEGDQLDELIDDEPVLEEGEIGLGQSGPVGAALRSHIEVFRASQRSGVNSSSAFERRQDARRERRASVLGLGVIGRGGRTDTSERTGTGASRLGGTVDRRARATHVPSIAGHVQQPTITTLESTLVHPAKKYYPLPIDTVHSWRTELERLASLHTRPGVFKNPSQYAAELHNVLKEIEENEEHPDLTVEVLLETKLMQVLKLFRHTNGDAGPGIRSMVPRVNAICRRCRVRLMNEGRVREIEEGKEEMLPVVASNSKPAGDGQSQGRE